MADYSNIIGGLNIPSQIPLDVKTFALNEVALSDLGTDDNLAYTYHEGLKVFCIEEKTTYIWREVGQGEENTGLVTLDFTYPLNIITYGIDYSERTFNFFQLTDDVILVNVGTGLETYKDFSIVGNQTTFNLRTLNVNNIGSNGLNLVESTTQGVDENDVNIRKINSNTLTLNIEVGGELSIEIPATSTVPGLYVNNDYIPSEEEFNNGNTKGDGSLAKPFTNTITAYVLGVPTITANTAIQNALDAYVGSGTRLLPELVGQKIFIQKSFNGYLFNGDFSYSSLSIVNDGYITSETSGYFVNMDNPSYFNTTTSTCTIVNTINGVIQTKGLGYLNSGNTESTTTYVTGRTLNLSGGIFYDNETYNASKSLINSDPLGVTNGSTGCNNDGNLTIVIKDARLVSTNNGISAVGGKSKIEFNKCDIISGSISGTVNASLKAFNQLGGIVRIFDSLITMSGGSIRDVAFTFSPTTVFENFTSFYMRNTRFTGYADVWFKKTTNFNTLFDVSSCTSLFFSGLQLFESTNLWAVSFNNNIFENITIDFTDVDFTNANNKSSINSIGNNVVEQLVKYPNRTLATAVLPTGSIFINTNEGPIDTPNITWKRDIVI